MPRLNTLIEVGFCSGYGDGDYRVTSSIACMEQKQYDELRLAVLGALNCADNMRRQYQEQHGEVAKMQIPTDTGGDGG